MRLDLKQKYLAISKEEYIDLDQHQLNSCLKLHTDYLCPNLRLTASMYVLSCAAAVFQTTQDDSLICSICQFTYYEHFTHTTSGTGNSRGDSTCQSAP